MLGSRVAEGSINLSIISTNNSGSTVNVYRLSIDFDIPLSNGNTTGRQDVNDCIPTIVNS